jgi:hypothetical protein
MCLGKRCPFWGWGPQPQIERGWGPQPQNASAPTANKLGQEVDQMTGDRFGNQINEGVQAAENRLGQQGSGQGQGGYQDPNQGGGQGQGGGGQDPNQGGYQDPNQGGYQDQNQGGYDQNQGQDQDQGQGQGQGW